MGSADPVFALRLSRVADFGEHFAAGTLLGLGVGPLGTVIGIIGDERSSKRRPTRRAAAALFVRDGLLERLDLEPVELGWWIRPQPLPGGGVLAIEARRLGGTPIAVVFRPDGRVDRRFVVGDGVEDALIDDSGQVWVSYFDEGVYGGGELAQAGLNRFDLAGQRTWSFPMTGRHEPIDDCYALNVQGNDAWAYYYAAFELLRVTADGDLTSWTTTVHGAKGIVAGSAGIVLVGTYEGWSHANHWTLGDGMLVGPRPVVIEAPSGGQLPVAPKIVGRGDTLYLLDAGLCYAATLEH